MFAFSILNMPFSNGMPLYVVLQSRIRYEVEDDLPRVTILDRNGVQLASVLCSDFVLKKLSKACGMSSNFGSNHIC